MNFRDGNGFSLIEGIFMIAIFALAMALLISFVIYVYRAYGYNFEQIAAINEARKGIETMVKEIREARYGEDGSYPLKEAGNLQLIFYSDIDKDASIERVRYFLDGINFKKGVVEPSGDPPQYILSGEVVDTLSAYVRNGATPIFIYYNGDWPIDVVNNPLPTLTRLTETKLMHVYLKINVDPNRPPDNFELESDVQIRNLKTNL
ncbi:MAG: type II secretion system protein [bacterium]|nr:type II secretion system protein [bacterium]